jgi:tetratricopeptide (TPR) repeat protein
MSPDSKAAESTIREAPCRVAPTEESARDRFFVLREEAIETANRGELETAVTLFDRALATARQTGDQNLIDLGLCGRSAAAIELGRGSDCLPSLREILVRNAEPSNCWVAAYNIARVYELTRNYKKALFYARLARDRAETLGRVEWRASSHNMIGNLLLAESFVEEATHEYEKALTLVPEEMTLRRARIHDNVGYCRVLQGRCREGLALLYSSLRALRRRRAEHYLISTHLDLCFAHLEIKRLRYARRHGEAALALATRQGDDDAVKNALYLLGQTATLAGDEVRAHAFFRRLQRDYYPDNPHVADFLMSVDVRQMINLRA